MSEENETEEEFELNSDVELKSIKSTWKDMGIRRKFLFIIFAVCLLILIWTCSYKF